MSVKIKVKIVDPTIPTELPKYATQGSAAVDLASVVDETILPMQWKLIPTNLAIEIPEGYEVQIRPRSGLAAKFGISIMNTPGTIDSDYRGEILCVVVNHSGYAYEIKKGDRIAQAVLSKVEQMEFEKVNELSTSERGTGGYGSTGK